MRLDHLILAVDDLAGAAAALLERTGLAAIAGGVHPDWGTANAIVPLGDAYLELVTVADPEVAQGSVFGATVAAATGRGGSMAPAGWAVVADDLEATAHRLGVGLRRGRRQLAGGGTLSWAMAGVDEALPGGLPFFLRWDDAAARPGNAVAPHRVTPCGVRWVEVGGSPEELGAWLGPHDLDVRFVGGRPPGPQRVAVGVHGGADVVLPPVA